MKRAQSHARLVDIESVKGLPLGYLSQLEKRLTETETALYRTLMTLGTIGPADLMSASVIADPGHKPKLARMDEWSQYSLHGERDLYRWMSAVSDRFSVEPPLGVHLPEIPASVYDRPISAAHDVDFGTSEATSQGELRGVAPRAWQRDEVHMESPYETHLHPQGLDSSSAYLYDQVEPSDSGASPDILDHEHGTKDGHIEVEQSRKADVLSKSKPCIYF
ncbi:hypothetical protein N7495_007585 [Penicillium taxi]|uniref:uncharacterized protein n=1 Tax=Penicillium taxi TaxID=168475 RepID=UPI002545645E|nr:uncharacterized protein N7495_007585 [Penicillium taxi]KAJ5887544.1 hypothetical protein N7495_007585 [Penicillium taxi]